MTQKEALDILKLGYNVFLTGGPGTGKTFVLNKFVQYLKVHNIPYSVTASTGIAATHIEGQTIHSFSGIGIKDNLSEFDLDTLSQKQNLNIRINKIKVLIIDEISMLQGNTLNNVNKIFKKIRRNSKPFGGIQMVFCGDFFQLPPVIRGAKDESLQQKSDNLLKQFAFRSESWKEANPLTCYLQKNFRQEDQTLVNILQMIRSKDEDIYDSLQYLHETAENILENPVRLYSHNADVDSVNIKHYESIKSKEYVFQIKEKGNAKQIENLKKNILALDTLKLKVGTKVIFVKNDKSGKYHNGTLGIVQSFDTDGYPNVEIKNKQEDIAASILNIREESWQTKDDNDKIIAEVQQLPLRYAWAITIHKSQGMTLEEAEIDLSKGFGFGMGYVALSRVRSLSGLRLLGLNNFALAVAGPVTDFDKVLKQNSKKAKTSINKYTTKDIELMHIKKIKEWGIDTEYYNDEQIENIIKSSADVEVYNYTKKEDTRVTTLRLIFENYSISEISKQRDLKIDTILDHISDIRDQISLGDIDLKDHSDLFEKVIYDYYQEYIKDKYQNNNLKDSYKKLYFKNNIINNQLLLEIKDSLANNIKLTFTYLKYKDQISGLDWTTLKIIKIL